MAKEEIEEEIKIKAKQVADNLVSFMKDLDTEANKQIKELEYDIEYYKSKIAELEKEKTELNDKLNKIERKCEFNFVDLLHDVENENKQKEQLTKATKIIKDLLKNTSFLCSCKYEKAREIENQAKQLLKEIKENEKEEKV